VTASIDTDLLEARQIRVTFGSVCAVDGVSLVLRRGEMTGLVGESGCGKSTLGRALTGLLPPTARTTGEIRHGGVDLLQLRGSRLRQARGAELGMIFQEPMTRLDPLMRISDHFAETLRAHRPGVSRRELERRALSALARAGIPPTRFRQYPHEFSGGMRQRIMIALALVLEPAFVVADEPTTSLDVLVEAQIVALLDQLKSSSNMGVLLITHNLALVAEVCDRVAVMYAGAIVEVGSVDRVLLRPAHPYTRELLRSTISLSTQELHSIRGAPPDLSNPPTGCRFHPRCTDAMRVCSTVDPVEVELEPDERVSCWLHGPFDEIPAGLAEPLPPNGSGE
jgi:peptide/nickel transport system ATP-binding protein